SRAMASASWNQRSGVRPLRRLALSNSAACLNSLHSARNSAQAMTMPGSRTPFSITCFHIRSASTGLAGFRIEISSPPLGGALAHMRPCGQVVHHLVSQPCFDLDHFAFWVVAVAAGEQLSAQETHVRVPVAWINDSLD